MTQTRPLSAARVSTTDLWKSVALVLILADHVGHFLLENSETLRVLGRWSIPIWFFLLGYGRTRDVPTRWLVLGAALTAVDMLWMGRVREAQVDILIVFALYRWGLPLAERHVLSRPERTALLVLALALSVPLVNRAFEYGSEGWLLALAGHFARLHRDSGDLDRGASRTRDAIGAVAVAVYLVAEATDYAFSTRAIVLLMVGTLVVAGCLRAFRRAPLALAPPEPIAAILRFGGRHSLEIYAGQIILLAAAGGLWSHWQA